MKTNGGKRDNAGRKPKYGDAQTKTLRVPISRIAEIETLLLRKENPNQTNIETEELRARLKTIETIVDTFKSTQNLTSPRWAQANKLIAQLEHILK